MSVNNPSLVFPHWSEPGGEGRSGGPGCVKGRTRPSWPCLLRGRAMMILCARHPAALSANQPAKHLTKGDRLLFTRLLVKDESVGILIAYGFSANRN